jgi:hypothetical protein
MYRPNEPEPAGSCANDSERDEATIRTPARDRRLRQAAADLTASAPCPICGAPFIPRTDCRGPYMFCLCVPRRAL